MFFQLVPSGDMVPPTPTVRASTPATSGTSYSPTYVNNGGVPAPGYAPYAGGAKSLLWYGSPPLPPLAAPHAPPPPPPHVNPNVYKSVQPSGADLPMHDIATLRFYFNVGVDCMRSAYGLPPAPPAHPPPTAHGPPPAHSSLVAVPAPPAPGAPAAPPAPSHSRHYTPRDLAQEMQQISLQDRDNNKYKQDKPPLMQQKPAQRPLLGPRFKRGGNNQEGNHNSSQNHHHNKGHNNNNNMPNKGTNNRRSSPRAPQFAPEDAEPPLVYPYIPYPPPVYPMQYYPVDSDPAMMGMMSGMGYMGYMGYEDGMEYAPVQHYYPPPNPPHPQPQPQPQPQPHPHPDNK
ncbi:unnamed protein product [Euphydryas editha]|uniref:Uncharacterized protein n=1 Tax=Euphydryas editha TaxID=104508 RepID=A0AAU9TGR2_EUPED|nr:unnamed protein product [Euphydryas editha]